VQSIAASIEENMKKEKALPIGVEGDRIGKWVLLDYGDILIHVFYEPVRSFYDLESLWPDAPRMDVDDNATRIKGLRKGM
jgi:ribosome-associated protein